MEKRAFIACVLGGILATLIYSGISFTSYKYERCDNGRQLFYVTQEVKWFDKLDELEQDRLEKRIDQRHYMAGRVQAFAGRRRALQHTLNTRC